MQHVTSCSIGELVDRSLRDSPRSDSHAHASLSILAPGLGAITPALVIEAARGMLHVWPAGDMIDKEACTLADKAADGGCEHGDEGAPVTCT